MATDVVGESAQAMAASLKDGEVGVIENVRFEASETKNDPELAKKMAAWLKSMSTTRSVPPTAPMLPPLA